MTRDPAFNARWYAFAVAELPRIRQALKDLQPTGLDWLDSIIKQNVISTCESFEDAIADYERAYPDSVIASPPSKE